MHCKPHPAAARRLHALAAAACLTLGAATSHAQTAPDRVTDLERKLEASLRLIDQLNSRMQQLEGKPAPAAASAPLANQVAELEQKVQAIVSRPEEDRGLAMHGFADVGFARSSLGHPSGGNVGSLDFYMTPKFGDRLTSLIELNFEVSQEGSVGVDLERLQVGYVLNDNLTLWAGRFHTPYGYWNTAFHHGAQLQTSTLRPMFLDFEDRGGILPAHSVGFWGTGAVKLDVGRLNYDLYLANSSEIGMGDPTMSGTGVLDMRQAGARDRRLMVGSNLSMNFKGALDGLTVGLHTLSGKIGDTLASNPHVTELGMVGAWATYNENNWEVMGETYHFSNREIGSAAGSRSSQAWYAQAGYAIGNFTPYARLERTTLDQNDPYFAEQASGQSYKRTSLGMRYELNPKAALKLEAMRTSLTDRAISTYTEVRSQVAVRF